jgi:hypothetical protein
MALGLTAGTLLLAVALGLHYRALYADVAEGRSLLLEARDILETGRLTQTKRTWPGLRTD